MSRKRIDKTLCVLLLPLLRKQPINSCNIIWQLVLYCCYSIWHVYTCADYARIWWTSFLYQKKLLFVNTSNCIWIPITSGSLIDWISDTRPQGCTDLQSPVKCLDHRYCVRSQPVVLWTCPPNRRTHSENSAICFNWSQQLIPDHVSGLSDIMTFCCFFWLCYLMLDALGRQNYQLASVSINSASSTTGSSFSLL